MTPFEVKDDQCRNISTKILRLAVLSSKHVNIWSASIVIGRHGHQDRRVWIAKTLCGHMYSESSAYEEWPQNGCFCNQIIPPPWATWSIIIRDGQRRKVKFGWYGNRPTGTQLEAQGPSNSNALFTGPRSMEVESPSVTDQSERISHDKWMVGKL